MRLFVMNREEAIRLSATGQPRGVFDMVSISTPGKRYHARPEEGPHVGSILEVEFYDSGNRDPRYLPCINDGQALAIARFVRKAACQGHDLAIHCDGGISRSAGVARAVAQYYNIPLREVRTNRPAQPNTTVYNFVLHALWMTE